MEQIQALKESLAETPKQRKILKKEKNINSINFEKKGYSMQPVYKSSTATANNVIDENGSLHQFYNLTNVLSKTRHVRFTGKNDEADNIEWYFKYRGRSLTLQYNIYNGVSIFPQDSKDTETVNRLLSKLKGKKV